MDVWPDTGRCEALLWQLGNSEDTDEWVVILSLTLSPPCTATFRLSPTTLWNSSPLSGDVDIGAPPVASSASTAASAAEIVRPVLTTPTGSFSPWSLGKHLNSMRYSVICGSQRN